MFKRARQTITDLFKTYGTVAVAVWVSTWVLGYAGFYLSTMCTMSSSGIDATCWQIGATAYGAFLLSYPLRVGATVTLTPPIALRVRRMRGLS